MSESLAKGTLVRLKKQYSTESFNTAWIDLRCKPGVVLSSAGRASNIYWSGIEDIETWNNDCIEVLCAC
jgi:hypothetical protein